MCALRDRTARPPECLGCVTAFRTRGSIPCAAMRLSLHEKRRDHFRHAFCLFNCLTNTLLKRRAVFPKQIEGAGTNDRYVFPEDAGKYASANSSNTDKCAACGLSDNPISRQNGLDPFCQLRHLPQPANPFGFAGNTYCTAYFPGLYRGVVRKGG